jgi:hypothetical protein
LLVQAVRRARRKSPSQALPKGEPTPKAFEGRDVKIDDNFMLFVF